MTSASTASSTSLPTTTSSSTTIRVTTATPAPVTPKIDGSGEIPSDLTDKSCRELYESFIDKDFPGGPPPPLSPGGEIRKELCEFLLTQKKLNTRQKRHRITDDDKDNSNNVASDDHKVTYLNAENSVLSDLHFVDDEAESLNTDNKAEAAAVKRTKSGGARCLAGTILMSISSAICVSLVLI